MLKCHFNKVAKQLYWNGTSAWVFSCKFASYFQNTFFLGTSLGGCFCIHFSSKSEKLFWKLREVLRENWLGIRLVITCLRLKIRSCHLNCKVISTWWMSASRWNWKRGMRIFSLFACPVDRQCLWKKTRYNKKKFAEFVHFLASTIKSNHRRYSAKKGALRNFEKFIGKHLCQSLRGLRPSTLLKKRLWHRCFPVNFAKFLRTPFLQNTSGRLLPYSLTFTHTVIF